MSIDYNDQGVSEAQVNNSNQDNPQGLLEKPGLVVGAVNWTGFWQVKEEGGHARQRKWHDQGTK